MAHTRISPIDFLIHEQTKDMLDTEKRMLNDRDSYLRSIRETLEKSSLPPHQINRMMQDTEEEFDGLPTPYQNPGAYKLMMHLINTLKQGLDSFVNSSDGSEVEWKEFPVFGTASIREVSAYITNTASPLIILSNSIFGLANQISKAIAWAYPVVQAGKKLSYSTNVDEIKKRLDDFKEPSGRFADLFFSYFMGYNTHASEQYYLEKRYMDMQVTFRDSFEIFVLAHEYSHYYFEHETFMIGGNEFSAEEVEGVKEKVIDNYFQEFEADAFGAKLTISAIQKKHDVDKTLAVAGVYLCLKSLELIRRVNNLRDGKDEDHFDSMTHPPFEMRYEYFRELVLEDDTERTGSFLDTIDFIVDYYWAEFKSVYCLVEERFKSRLDLQIRDLIGKEWVHKVIQGIIYDMYPKSIEIERF